MVEYIYFVKCPDCEDEHFDFFDEAKCYAMRRLGQKPIITQTEVNRNDFGECTDHCDLGTVWSWENIVGKDFETEPVEQVFTKDDLKNLPVDNDPEFDDDDFYFMNNTISEDYSRRVSFKSKAEHNEFMKLCSEIGIITGEDLDRFMVDHKADDSNLLDKLRAYRDELGTDFKLNPAERKPIPEGMTIEELVEEMEENEDTVECTWCNDLFDKSECRKEVDLGWLCSRCEAAIKSRGETLTFRENNYWDFLDEELKPKTWICEFDGREIGTVEASTEEEAYEAMEREYPEYHYGLYDGVAIVYPADEDELDENVKEIHDLGNEYDGGYPDETPEVSDSHLKLCPECGKEMFDTETGICVSCGFN